MYPRVQLHVEKSRDMATCHVYQQEVLVGTHYQDGQMNRAIKISQVSHATP